MRALMRIQLASIVLLAACAQQKVAVDDDFTSLEGQDVKSDSFSYRMKIVGSLTYDQTSASTKYTATPRYRAFKFAGADNDAIDVWVRSTDGGDAVAWVLDNGFHVLASNDDADTDTFDAHMTLTLPHNASATHYVVFRDYSTQAAHFKVALSGGSSCTNDADCTAAAPDGQVSECSNDSHQCELVDIADIKCGGHTIHQHACPTGYTCQGPQLASDGFGSCLHP